MQINVIAKTPEHVSRLTEIGKVAKPILLALSEEYGFQMPARLRLKIYFPRKREKKKTLTFAQAETGGGEHTIKFNPCMFTTTREHLMDKIAHEVAHIAEELHVERFGHSKLFYQMEEKAKRFAKEIR